MGYSKLLRIRDIRLTLERIERQLMDKQGIINTLQMKITADILNIPEKKIKSDESIIESGLIDSFSLVDLSMLIEDMFDVRIDDTELNSDTFDTLEQLADLILSRK